MQIRPEWLSINCVVLGVFGLLATAGIANAELVCDNDQLSDSCIECLRIQQDENQVGVCYEASLPAPFEPGEIRCPSSKRGFTEATDRVGATTRQIMLENARLSAELRPYENSSGDCGILPSRFLSQVDDQKVESDNTTEAENAVTPSPVQHLLSCIASTKSELFERMRDSPDLKVFSDYAIAIGDAEISMGEMNSSIEEELMQQRLLLRRAKNYGQDCAMLGGI